MKLRLIAGTINAWPDNDGYRNFTLDVSNRGIWDHDLEMTVQPDFIGDIALLPQFRDETFDEVRIHHVLEHLPVDRARLALRELARILKPGGVLDIEVPDVLRVSRAWLNDEIDDAAHAQWILGEQLSAHEPGDSHRSLWTESTLRRELADVGALQVGEREETGLALRLRAVKP